MPHDFYGCTLRSRLKPSLLTPFLVTFKALIQSLSSGFFSAQNNGKDPIPLAALRSIQRELCQRHHGALGRQPDHAVLQRPDPVLILLAAVGQPRRPRDHPPDPVAAAGPELLVDGLVVVVRELEVAVVDDRAHQPVGVWARRPDAQGGYVDDLALYLTPGGAPRGGPGCRCGRLRRG